MLYVIIGKSDENDTFHDGNFLIASFNEKEINLKKLYRYKIYKVYRVEIRDGQIFEYYTFTVNTFYEVLGLQDQMGYYYGNIIYCPIDILKLLDKIIKEPEHTGLRHDMSFYMDQALKIIREDYPLADESCFSGRYAIDSSDGRSVFLDMMHEEDIFTMHFGLHPEPMPLPDLTEEQFVKLLAEDGIESIKREQDARNDPDAECTIYTVVSEKTDSGILRCVSSAHEFTIRECCFMPDEALQPCNFKVVGVEKRLAGYMETTMQGLPQIYRSPDEIKYSSKAYTEGLRKKLHGWKKRFHCSCGGFFGGYTDCTLDEYGFLILNPRENICFRKTVSDDDWIEFISTCMRIGVNDWNKEYVDPAILDGCQWEVKLRVGPLRISSHGSNAYPKGFDRFTAAVRKLLKLTTGQFG